MIGVTRAFAPRYARARVQFLEAAATAGLRIESQVHPLPGAEGEVLALDVARDGPAQAERLLIVSSASHGADGACGSGVQVFALHDAEWRDRARGAGVALLYLHALDPYGFSHLRSATHENVDLPCNFADFGQPLAVNATYHAAAPLLLLPQWPPDAGNAAALQALGAPRGEAAWLAALARGQHSAPQGLFYGGTAPCWSHRCLRQVLRQHGGAARCIGWIDLHTGPGPFGLGLRAAAGDAAALARGRRWWDGAGATPVHARDDAHFPLAGRSDWLARALQDACPQAEGTAMALSFGTAPLRDWLDGWRAGQWLQLHPGAAPALAAQVRAQRQAMLQPGADGWQGQVIAQARQALFQAVDGLT